MLVNDNYFREVAISGIPSFSPLSYEYVDFWKEQKKRCMHGYTVGGKWMPGKLYWYVNFWHIERSTVKGQRKSSNLPDLREIEWEVFPLIEKAKGHSGFDSTGMPVYTNPVKGIMMITPRRMGKSNIVGTIAGHEYTFYRNNEILVTASIEQYTNDCMKKIRYGLDNLKGGMTYNGESYPAPFAHARVKNNWEEIIMSGKKVVKDGLETVAGYQSRIIPIVYGHNTTAANGKTPSVHIFEEVGMFPNLKKCYADSTPGWMDEDYQFGIPLLIGTGGDMEKGSIHAKEMFENPEEFNLMAFESENSDKKVCYFIPAWKNMSTYKDEKTGLIDKEKAIDAILKKREKKKRDKDGFEKEIQYYPLTYHEAFLQSSGNIFPQDLLQLQIDYISSTKQTKNIGRKGILKWVNGKVEFEEREDVYEVDFPHTKTGKHAGACVVYELPEVDVTGKPPFNVYLAGCDPYGTDKTDETYSLGSFMIYKKLYSAEKTRDVIVFEYTGRPETSEEFDEICRKACYFYNAKVLYEDQGASTLRSSFMSKSAAHYLKTYPTILHNAIPGAKAVRTYGMPMGEQEKNFLINTVNNFLRKEYSPGRFNTEKIYSMNLLKELIMYTSDRKKNFDRVMSFGLALIHAADDAKYETDQILAKSNVNRLAYYFDNPQYKL